MKRKEFIGLAAPAAIGLSAFPEALHFKQGYSYRWLIA
jgi:hypothetical protein